VGRVEGVAMQDAVSRGISIGVYIITVRREEKTNGMTKPSPLFLG